MAGSAMLDETCKPNIVAGLVVDEPFATPCYEEWLRTGKCDGYLGPGNEVEYMTTLLRDMMKLTNITVRPFHDYPEQQEAFAKGEFDVYFSSFQVKPDEIATETSLATPVYQYDGVGLLVKETYELSKTSLIGVFTWDLWLAICGATFLYFLVEVAYTRLIRPFSKRPWHYENRIFYSVIWLIILGLIMNLYSNIMAIALFSNSLQTVLPIKSMEDLGQKLLSKTCRFVITRDYEGDEDFWPSIVDPKDSKKPWAAAFAAAYAQGPKPILVDDRDAMADEVMTSTDTACKIGLDYRTMAVYYTNRKCGLQMMSFTEDLPNWGYVFYYRNISCIRHVIETVMATNPIVGYSARLQALYQVAEKPLSCSKDQSSKTVLQFAQLVEAFYLMIGGAACAIVILLIEFAQYRIAMRKAWRKMAFKALRKKQGVTAEQVAAKTFMEASHGGPPKLAWPAAKPNTIVTNDDMDVPHIAPAEAPAISRIPDIFVTEQRFGDTPVPHTMDWGQGAQRRSQSGRRRSPNRSNQQDFYY